MSDHQDYDSATHPIVRLIADYNAIRDHAFRKGWSYLIYYDSDDSLYKAVEGVNGTLHATTNTDAAVVMNAVRSTVDTAGGGVIGFLDHAYQCATAFTGANNVSLEGENMGPFESFTQGTILEYTGPNATAILNYEACRWFSIRNLKLYNSSGNTIKGLYCGDTTNSANKSKGIYLENVVVDSFDYGIQGSTWGPDDSTFNHVWVGNSDTIGIDNLSSQCCFTGGSIYENPIGVRVQRAAGTSADASLQFYGTVFSGNPVHIEIDGDQSINTLTFTGCWLEDTDTMILRTTNATAGINCGSVLFDNCVASVNIGSSTTWMDLSARTIRVEINGGSWVTTGDIAEGACDAGSNATTLVDAAVLTQIDDYWNNYYVRYLNGDRAGERALISDFDQGTNTATHGALTGAPAVGDHYVIGGARIICDGTGSTNQFLRVTNIVGQNHVYLTDTSSGLSGFQRRIVPLIDDINAYTPGAPLNTTFVAVGHDHDLPFRKYETVKATHVVRWTPGADWNAGVGVEAQLYFDSGELGVITATGAGNTVDSADCSDYVRFKCGDWGDVAFQAHDNNANAPTFYYTWLVIEF
jgi:hypothetical protein